MSAPATVAYPRIIQGGMGVAISSWKLARAVSMHGQLGVVSGTGLDCVFARRLQLGDFDGTIREALSKFPVGEVARRVLDRFYIEGGKKPNVPFKSKPMPSVKPTRAFNELAIVASFVEVELAKAGHEGPVGINLLEKIQLSTLPTLLGAMMAGVDYVLMGAGIPRQIPGVLDEFSEGRPGSLVLDVAGALPDETFTVALDPADFGVTQLRRPRFLAIVSSSTLASSLARKSSGQVDGLVVEGDSAGGHNAPPRGELVTDDRGEPVYGPRDVPDIDQIRALGLPFWLAGSYGRQGKLSEALALGAEGIQVGTAFAFCEESGMDQSLKERVLQRILTSPVEAFTDPYASPTGFPFKVVDVEETLADPSIYEARPRTCDLGYLRQLYRLPDGKVGYRCPAEPEADYAKKDGPGDTAGRKCLCNSLLATAGLGQIRKDGYREPAIVTAGRDVSLVAGLIESGRSSYTATDVVDWLLEADAKTNVLWAASGA